jgi:hypothetical protein
MLAIRETSIRKHPEQARCNATVLGNCPWTCKCVADPSERWGKCERKST